MKVPQGLTREEQETFFRTDPTLEFWQFYSRDPAWKRRLERQGYEVTEDHQGLWAAKVPKGALSLRRKDAKKPDLTPEERQKRAERLKSFRDQRGKRKVEA